jgi:hypothetical protein
MHPTRQHSMQVVLTQPAQMVLTQLQAKPHQQPHNSFPHNPSTQQKGFGNVAALQ